MKQISCRKITQLRQFKLPRGFRVKINFEIFAFIKRSTLQHVISIILLLITVFVALEQVTHKNKENKIIFSKLKL